MNHNEIPEKPILMSGPMVLAILADLKTQTRRTTGLKKINEDPDRYLFHKVDGGVATFWDSEKGERVSVKLPYGLPGHRLWVREAWAAHIQFDHLAPRNIPKNFAVDYLADNRATDLDCGKNRPSIFMMRESSRINLEIAGIRIERLQDISEADCEDEGCHLEWYRDNAGAENLWPCPKCQGFQVHGCVGENMGMSECDCLECDTSKKMFRHLWESINGPGSWAANPWLFVVEFERVK